MSEDHRTPKAGDLKSKPSGSNQAPPDRGVAIRGSGPSLEPKPTRSKSSGDKFTPNIPNVQKKEAPWRKGSAGSSTFTPSSK